MQIIDWDDLVGKTISSCIETDHYRDTMALQFTDGDFALIEAWGEDSGFALAGTFIPLPDWDEASNKLRVQLGLCTQEDVDESNRRRQKEQDDARKERERITEDVREKFPTLVAKGIIQIR
jgi:hypothetical protein